MVSLPPLKFSITADLSGLKSVDRELTGLGRKGQTVGQAINQSLKESANNAAGAFREAGGKSGSDFGEQFSRGADGKVRDSFGRLVGAAKNAGGDAGKGFGGAFKGAIGNVFQGIAQGIGQQLTAGLGAAINGLKGLAIDREAIASYDKARAQVSTLSNDMAGMAKMAQEVSKAVGQSASQTEVLAASYDVLSAGFSEAADAANILTASQKGAIGGMSDLGTVSNATTTILNAYGLAAADADKVVNQMIGTQNAGKIVVGEYAHKIGAVATTAAQAGVSLEELNAFIATATVKGVSANSSIDGMRQAISSVLKPSQEAAEYAAQLGVNFSAAGLRAGGLSGILQQLRQKNADSADSLVRLFGSVEAVAAIIPSAGDGLEDFAKNLETIKTASADDAFGKMQNSIEGLQKKNAVLREELALKFQITTAPLFEAANNGMTTLLSSLNEGGVLFEGLNQAAASFRDFLAQNPEIIATMTAAFTELVNSGIGVLKDSIIGFTNALRENPQLIQQMVAGLAGAVQSGVAFAQGMGTALTNIGNLLTPLAQLVGGLSGSVQGANNLAGAFGQIVVYSAVFAPIVSALSSIVSLGSSIVGIFGGWAAIQTTIASGVTGLVGSFSAVAAAIPPITLGLAAAFIWLDNIKNYSENWNDVVLGINFTIQETIDWFGGVFDAIGQNIQQSEIFQGVWRVVTQTVQFLIKPFQDVFNWVAQGVQRSEVFRGIWDGLKGIVQGVADAFTTVGGAALDGLIQRAQSLFGWLKNIAGFNGGGGGGMMSGGGGVSGGSASEADKFVGAVLSILEAPSRQGRVDVAQVVSNRVGTNFGGFGGSIRDQAFAPGQFQPFFAETYGIGKNDIQNKESAIAALQKAGYSVQQATEAIDNFFADIADNAKVADSAAKVGGRAYFKGVSEYGNMQGDDFLRNHGENFFHHENSDTTNRVQASISALFGGGSSGGMGAGVNSLIGGAMSFGNGAVNQANAGKVIVNRTGQKDENGLEVLSVQTFDKSGRNVGQFTANSGIRSTQGNFGERARTEAGTNNPLPFGDYSIGDTVQAPNIPGYGRLTTIMTPQFATARAGIEAHVDGNRDISPGSAGCLVFKTEAEFEAFMQSVRESGANTLRFEEANVGMMQGMTQGFQQPGMPNLTQAFAAGKINNSLAPGAALDNTVANLKADKSAENQAMIQAVTAARAKEDAATKTKRDEAARQLKQEREAAKLKLEGEKAGLTTPEAKEASDRALKQLEIRAQYEDRLLDLEQKRADLVTARDRKLTDMNSKDVGVQAAAKAMPDFSAQIKAYDALIAKDKELQESALKNITIADDAKQAEADRTAAIARRNAELETSLEFSKAERQLELERASRIDPMMAKQIEFANQRQELQEALNKEIQEEYDKLTDIERKLGELAKLGQTDSPEMRRLQADRNTVNMRIGDMQATAKVKMTGLDESQAFESERMKRDRAQALFQKEQMMSEGGIGMLQKQARKMQGFGDVDGANRLEKEAALAQNVLEYRQKYLELESRIADLRSKGVQVSEQEAAKMREGLAAAQKFDLTAISDQFNTFKTEILPTVQSSVGGFFKDLVSGTKSVGEAFSDMLGNIASKLLDFATNQIMSSIFGGLFGGGGGLGGTKAVGGGVGGFIGKIFGFSDGGIVGGGDAGGLRAIPAIDQALKREGPNGIIAALTPGEMVLTTRQTQAFLNSPMANEILNFNRGGIVPGAGSPIAASSGAGAVSVNVPVTVNGGGNGVDWSKAQSELTPQFEMIIANFINKQKRDGGML